MTFKKTDWILTRPQPEPTALLNLKFAAKLLVDPRKCDHPRPTFNGTIWFCQTCGEPIRDRDERRQAEIDL